MLKTPKNQGEYTTNLMQITERLYNYIIKQQNKQFATKILSSYLNVDHSKLMSVCLIFSAIRLIEVYSRNYQTFSSQQLIEQNHLFTQELQQKQFTSTKDQYDLTLNVCCQLFKKSQTFEQLLESIGNSKLKLRIRNIITVLETINFVKVGKDHLIQLTLFYDQFLKGKIEENITPNNLQSQISSLVNRSTPQSLSGIKSLISFGSIDFINQLSGNI